MNTKQKLTYIVLGGVLVVAGMIISPLNAQKDNFGKIECAKLTIVDEAGRRKVMLGEADGGFVSVKAKDGMPAVNLLSLKEHGGGKIVTLPYESTDVGTAMGTDENGGYVKIYNIHHRDLKAEGELFINEYGCILSLRGIGDSKGQAIISIKKKRNGTVATYDKYGYILKQLGSVEIE